MEFTCGTFFVSKDNKLLICHPTNASKNTWSIPKGLRDKDESSLDAAIRELKEETGIMVGQVTLIDICQVYKNGKKTLIPHYHKSEIDSKEYKLVCNSIVKLKDRQFPEVDIFNWVTIEDAKKLLHDTQVKCLDEIEKLILISKENHPDIDAKEFAVLFKEKVQEVEIIVTNPVTPIKKAKKLIIKKIIEKYPTANFTSDKTSCYYCKRVTKQNTTKVVDGKQTYNPEGHSVTKDHIFPRSKGGVLMNNSVWACYDCNRDKDNLTIVEWKDKVSKGVKPNKDIILKTLDFMISKLYPKHKNTDIHHYKLKKELPGLSINTLFYRKEYNGVPYYSPHNKGYFFINIRISEIGILNIEWFEPITIKQVEEEFQESFENYGKLLGKSPNQIKNSWKIFTNG